jgi:hypothetical protein
LHDSNLLEWFFNLHKLISFEQVFCFNLHSIFDQLVLLDRKFQRLHSSNCAMTNMNLNTPSSVPLSAPSADQHSSTRNTVAHAARHKPPINRLHMQRAKNTRTASRWCCAARQARRPAEDVAQRAERDGWQMVSRSAPRATASEWWHAARSSTPVGSWPRRGRASSVRLADGGAPRAEYRAHGWRMVTRCA